MTPTVSGLTQITGTYWWDHFDMTSRKYNVWSHRGFRVATSDDYAATRGSGCYLMAYHEPLHRGEYRRWSDSHACGFRVAICG